MTTGGSGQGQVHGGRGRGDGPASGDVTASGQEQLKVSGTDDLLDEIDGLLESNAEEFVKSYVQKGGQ
ncbi:MULTISPECIES: ubiquitin-like protein Pup [Corynebacterium]|jgi:ubiquitin-like protein Pup|uniref:Prokaryotic ubiquitin-like protein Pup n=1 Tax=Corynebacterium provencense TaxID=1737425 RepID=A0A2Z3YNR2_9CORY|nr:MULTISPECIES: ubiquitin-like protein Pup [Corynebacterium]AWT26222.1 Prokaryotic ubiquitin-like protein Pup [Corynebacterium provencense]MCI1257019.1 ubiquitin-like protein Pup [Corynebacterium provencense]